MKGMLAALLVASVCLSGNAADEREGAPASLPAAPSQQDIEAQRAERRAEREKRRSEFRARMEKRRAEHDARMSQEIQKLNDEADANERRAKAKMAETSSEVSLADERRPAIPDAAKLDRSIRAAVRDEIRPLMEEIRQLRRELNAVRARGSGVPTAK